MKTEYVVVFPIFGEGQSRQVLVHFKTTGPLGARGLNGFGGKLEEGESVEDALRRELDEEINAELEDARRPAWGVLKREEFSDCVLHVCWARITGVVSCRGADTQESRLSLWLRSQDIAAIFHLVDRWAAGAINYAHQALEVA